MQATIAMRVAMTTFVAVLTIAVQPSAQSQTYTTFDPPGSIGNLAINQTGVIAGSYYDAGFVSHGFLRTADGTITPFDPKGSSGTTPEAINSGGAITGFYYDAGFVSHGFLRTADGTTSFDPPGSTGTTPFAINPAGAITGTYTTGTWADQNLVSHGFLRSADGTFTSFDVDVPGSEGTFPLSINPAGVITGYYLFGNQEFSIPVGFVRDAKSSITTIAPATNIGPSYLVDDYPYINPAGTIAGTATNLNVGASGFYLRDKDGTINFFDNLPGMGIALSIAINQEGTVTGCYSDLEFASDGSLTHFSFDSFVRAKD
jgi:hypothetical protein